jgi:CheY-like chemotaxis protein
LCDGKIPIKRSEFVDTPNFRRFANLCNEMLDKKRRTGVNVSESAIGLDNHANSLATGHQAILLNSTQKHRSAKHSAPGKIRKRKPSSRRYKRRALVVDDVPDVTEMIGLFLKHAGYDVATADSGTGALQLANERAFDVVISDIGMPEMNGCELAASLRQRAEYQSIPIIAVTGFSEYDNRELALRAGFNAQLTKPIDPSELLQLIDELLG